MNSKHTEKLEHYREQAWSLLKPMHEYAQQALDTNQPVHENFYVLQDQLGKVCRNYRAYCRRHNLTDMPLRPQDL